MNKWTCLQPLQWPIRQVSHLRWKTNLIKTTKWSKVTQPGSTELLLHYYYLHYYTYYFDLKYNISSMHASSFSPGVHCSVFIKCSVNKSLPAMWETQVWSLGEEDPLEKEIAIHSSILAWRVPMDRRVWQVTLHGVSKSWTWLSDSAHTCKKWAQVSQT